MYEPLIYEDVIKGPVYDGSEKNESLEKSLIARIDMTGDSTEHHPVFYLKYEKPRTYTKYRSRQSRILGIVQIICACVGGAVNSALVTNAVLTEIHNFDTHGYFMLSAGIWGAIFTILSGAFAVFSARSRRRCPIIAHMVFAIISTLSAATLIIQATITICDSLYPVAWSLENEEIHEYRMIVMWLSGVLLICGVVQVITCVWSATLSCRVTCCGTNLDQIRVETTRQSAVPFAPSEYQPGFD